jgi:proline dehydrogenase
VTRALFLYLSQQRGLRRFMEQSSASKRLTSRFIAGITLDDEMAVCRRLHGDGILSTLDHLGENVTSADEAAASVQSYLDSLNRIAELKLPSTVSIKLTQFGLDFSDAICRANVLPLVDRAREIGTRVEIDMEGSAYTERTIALVRELHQHAGCVRAVIQAYLHRSERDIEQLNEQGIPVRLCKGAYSEPADIAIPAKSDVDGRFVTLMKTLLDRGHYPAIASHDDRIVREAFTYSRRRGIPPDRFEFQMLYGIRRDLQREVLQNGFRLRLYVPYGDAWYPYFMRRLAERPANVWFILRNMLHS